MVLDHLALWGLKEKLESRETEDLKGHVDQKVLQASPGVTAMQDSQGLSVSLELPERLILLTVLARLTPFLATSWKVDLSALSTSRLSSLKEILSHSSGSQARK